MKYFCVSEAARALGGGANAINQSMSLYQPNVLPKLNILFVYFTFENKINEFKYLSIEIFYLFCYFLPNKVNNFQISRIKILKQF